MINNTNVVDSATGYRSDKEKYFANKPADEAASILLKKAESWFHYLQRNKTLEKIRRTWMAYHGSFYQTLDGAHSITFSGEQGEIVNLPVNHFRNLAQHILVMITATRPAVQARATNTDYKSLAQTELANGLLDYYLREKRLEKYLKTACEYAIVLSAGYIKMEWNATTGQVYDTNPELGTPVYEGDVEFSNLSPLDVVFDTTKESSNHDWVLCRSFKNRHSIAAKYPEFHDKILSLPTKSDIFRFRMDVLTSDETDDIPVYEFFHKRDEALPDGRYILFLSDDIVLVDADMPYRSLPVFRMSPGDILGTPFGYTPLFDLLPIQDALNSLYSTVLTNHNAFGVQNIIVPRGFDMQASSLYGGLNIIEGNTQVGKPEALNLLQTSPETYKFIEMLERTMETLSGVNSVARGNPEQSLKSGAALALVQSMALQFISGLQQSYVELIEDVGTGLINMLKDFASVPRVAAIAGKNNKTIMKEFVGDDLSTVNRVIVDVGNPLSHTTAGRMQIAENLIQYGLIKNPQQYITLMNTGSLDAMVEDSQSQLMLMKQENEKMMSGEEVIALAVDQHQLHIQEHQAVLADPDLRKDPKLVNLVLNHIQEHIQLLQTTDPNLLQLLGQQPLAPPQQPQQQGAPQDQGQGQPPQNVGGPMQQPTQGIQGMQEQGQSVQGPGMEKAVNLPKMPSPPAPFQNNPTQAQNMQPK
jgi:hypothetical protein